MFFQRSGLLLRGSLVPLVHSISRILPLSSYLPLYLSRRLSLPSDCSTLLLEECRCEDGPYAGLQLHDCLEKKDLLERAHEADALRVISLAQEQYGQTGPAHPKTCNLPSCTLCLIPGNRHTRIPFRRHMCAYLRVCRFLGTFRLSNTQTFHTTAVKINARPACIRLPMAIASRPRCRQQSHYCRVLPALL